MTGRVGIGTDILIKTCYMPHEDSSKLIRTRLLRRVSGGPPGRLRLVKLPGCIERLHLLCLGLFSIGFTSCPPTTVDDSIRSPVMK